MIMYSLGLYILVVLYGHISQAMQFAAHVYS